MKENPSYKLKVVAGIHKGAELFLEQEMTYHIGSGDDCDVILLDTGIETKHLSLSVSQGEIRVHIKESKVFIEGQKLLDTETTLSDFQVLTVGEAHLAIGPAHETWPDITLPALEQANQAPASLELVPVDTSRNLPQRIKLNSRFICWLKNFCGFITAIDKKILFAICSFLLVLGIFFLDTWHASIAANTTIGKSPGATGNKPIQHKSFLLSMIETVMNMRQDTLVSSGLKEPAIPVQTQAVEFDDPTDKVRQVLQETWHGNLVETRTDDSEIQFQGYNQENQMDLLLSLDTSGQGEINAQGYTLSKKKKKEVLSQLNDTIRMKIEAADDIENLCKRVLKKKGVKQPDARFKIEDKSFTLKGQSEDHETISTIQKIITKAFPDIKVNNELTLSYPLTDKPNIIGVSTSGARHVMLNDGSKIFKGGRLDNGCTVIKIESEYIVLNCKGKNINYKIGD